MNTSTARLLTPSRTGRAFLALVLALLLAGVVSVQRVEAAATISVGGPAQVDLGNPYPLSITIRGGVVGQGYTTNITWGDTTSTALTLVVTNATKTNFGVSHTYTNAGTYTVYATLPSEAASGSATAKVVSLTPIAPVLSLQPAPIAAPCGSMSADPATGQCYLQLGVDSFTLYGSINDDDSSSWMVVIFWDDFGTPGTESFPVSRSGPGTVQFNATHRYIDYPNPADVTRRAQPTVDAIDDTFLRTSQNMPLPGVLVKDTTPPVVTVPGAGGLPPVPTVSADSSSGGTVVFGASATDNDPSLAFVCQIASGPLPAGTLVVSGQVLPIGTTVINCTATDRAANATSGSFSVTVADRTPPVFTLFPQDATFEAFDARGLAVTFTVVANDNVSLPANILVSCDHASGAIFPIGATKVTCLARDEAANQTVQSFTITVKDTTPPVLTLPVAVNVNATGPTGAIATFSVSATDILPLSPAVLCVGPAGPVVSGDAFPLGTTTVDCSATDASNNTGFGSFTVVVTDVTPPDLTVPANISVPAAGPAGTPVTYTVSAFDAVALTNVSIVCLQPSGATFPVGTSTVTCTATDPAGNFTTKTFTITVVDDAPPVLTVPANLTLEATGPAGATATYAVTALDAIDPAPAIICTTAPAAGLASGSTFPLGVTTVSCTAKDASGNASAPQSFTVTVKDTTPPVVTVPANIALNATSPSGAVATYAVSATDTVDPNPVLSCTSAPTPGLASGSTFPVGTTTVTCSATDASGNTSPAGILTVTVKLADTTPPVLTVPADMVVNAPLNANAATVTYTVSAVDDQDPNPVITCTSAPVAGRGSGSSFPVGVTTITCTAKDALGNTSAPKSFTITVKDTTPPVVTVPANMIVSAIDASGAPATYAAPTATDNIDGALPPVCTSAPAAGLASGSTFPLGTTTITCTATDAAGNSASKSFTITVKDTTPPVLTVSANVTVTAAPGATTAIVTYTAATATDNVDAHPAASCTPASGTAFPIGTATVTCTATDAAGNTSTKTFTVTVKSADSTPPALTVPANITAYTGNPSGVAITYAAPTATDDKDPNPTVVCTSAPTAGLQSGSNFPVGTTTITCKATDNAGNSTTKSFTVTVVLVTGDFCKKNGWKLFTSPRFKNQGDCVSYFATNTKNPPAYIDGDRDDNSNNGKDTGTCGEDDDRHDSQSDKRSKGDQCDDSHNSSGGTSHDSSGGSSSHDQDKKKDS